MRIEKIEGNKIRVTLTVADLSDYNMNIKSLKPDSPMLHTFLFKIMERVKRETGFNPYTGQIIVEANPSEDGVVLVVTKISEEKPYTNHRAKFPGQIRAVKKAQAKPYICCIESFDDLCGLFEAVDAELLLSCRLYVMDQKFYLVGAALGTGLLDYMTEFGTVLGRGDRTEAFLAEHGRLDAEGATLSDMACRIKKQDNTCKS